MSDSIKHECGIAILRLLKPIDFYYKKYGTNLYGLNKNVFNDAKQVNRGQDGSGLVTLNLMFHQVSNIYLEKGPWKKLYRRHFPTYSE